MFNDNKIDPNELVELLQKIITRVEVLEKNYQNLNDKVDRTIIDLNLLKKDVEDSKKKIIGNSNYKIASPYPVNNLSIEERLSLLEDEIMSLRTWANW